MKPISVTRRDAMTAMVGATGAAMMASPQATAQTEGNTLLKGNIKQSVSRWCYSKIPMDVFCKECKAMGLVGIDLLGPNDWGIVQEHGLIPTMASGPGSIKDGWNELKNHKELIQAGEARLKEVADAGLPNMIVFSGNRRELSDAEGLKNCALGLKEIMPMAEELGVNVVMELLNSKRSHKDYMCDHTAWGAELGEKLGSPNFKLLYDIFHMQIMEGDIIDTLRDYKQYIGHIHTGGVPGRNEIDDSQELNYTRICEAIVEIGFEGYVAHEFVPKSDNPLESLRQAVQICDV